MAIKILTPLVAVFFVLTLGSTLPSMDAVASLDPTNSKARTFLASLGERAIQVVQDESATREEQEARMRALLREGFDLNVLARLVLGKHWRKLDKDQRREFITVFEEAMVQQTLTMFGKYTGETFDIKEVAADRTNPKLIAASVDLIRPNGALLAKVNYRIRKDGDEFKVIDIVAEGVSLALTLRHEYAAVIERSNGKVEGLIERLRSSTAWKQKS